MPHDLIVWYIFTRYDQLLQYSVQKFTPCYQKRQKSHHSKLLLWDEQNHLMLKWVARTPDTQMWFLILSGLSPPPPTKAAARIFLCRQLILRKQNSNPNSALPYDLLDTCWWRRLVGGDANRKVCGGFPVLWLQHRRYKQKIRWCVGAMTQYTPFSHKRIICNLTQYSYIHNNKPTTHLLFLIQTTTKILISGKWSL